MGSTFSLLTFYTSPSYKDKPYYINKKGRDVLNERLSSLKLCLSISRKPRSLLHLKLFKGSEFRTMLLYCLPVCLNGLLDPMYIEHLNLLSSTVYKLLGTSINQADLEEAQTNLKEFTRLYELYFGQSKMVLNVHQLIHIPDCVKEHGPLWLSSMFDFESQNGTLGKYFHGKNNVVKEISLRYMLVISITGKENNISNTVNLNECSKSDHVLFPRKKIELNSDDILLLENHNIPPSVFNHNKLTIFTRYQKGAEKFTSVAYSRAKKTIDYFIKMHDNNFGKILYYFVHNSETYMIVEQFVEIGKINHIFRLIPVQNVILLAKEIKQKMLYMQVNSKHYAVSLPNRIERD